MGADKDSVKGFDAIIREQRANQPDLEKILATINNLPLKHLAEYLGFLEHKYRIKPEKETARLIFRKLGIEDQKFAESFSGNLNSRSLEKLLPLVLSKSDRLLDNFLNTPFPDKMINEYTLLKANRINQTYKGHFSNALELIKLGIEINKGKNPEELFAIFKEMKNRYYATKFPPVDVNTFFKLAIPVLKRCSIRKGPDGFYDIRDRIIQELGNDGLTPDQLSIDILDRRGKHRAPPLNLDIYKGFVPY